MNAMAVLLDGLKPDREAIEKALRHDINSLLGEMDGLLLEVLEYGLFGGGKRLRPLLAVIAARLCGPPQPEVFSLAIAFEYLHLATLFHDDIIDQADTRRGKPSVYRAYGLAPAILAGDFLHARSMAIIGNHGGSEALKIFSAATGGMVDGEFLQIRNARNFNQSEEDYFDAILGKTALLIAATTEIGALYGGAGQVEARALREYGRQLGCAFQIIDDLLDYTGDGRDTGKEVGNDLQEGKMTLPLIFTMESADPEERRRLLDILNVPQLRNQSLAEVSALIEKYHGFTRTRKMAEGCIEMALAQLDIFSPGKKVEKEILAALGKYVLLRNK